MQAQGEVGIPGEIGGWTMKMSVEIKGLEEAKKMLSGDLMRKALRSTIDKAGTEGKRYMVGSVSSMYNVKAKDVRDAITVKRTTQTSLELFWKIKSKMLSLFAYFGARQDRSGVYVNVSRSHTKHIPGAFIATARRGNNPGWRGIMKRMGRTRYPLTSRDRGPAIPELISPKDAPPTIWEATERRVRTFMSEEFWKQVQARMRVK
jgi:hypothetical protein